MNKESLYLLQLIDTNCNDCLYMERDMSRLPKKGIAMPVNYGHCTKLNNPVSFIPATCEPQNKDCFKHRREG